VYCKKRFNPNLYGRRYTFIVDHEPLVTMRKLKDPMGRIGNLLHKLQDCDYDMVYQPGHVTPDLLSRPSKTDVNILSIGLQFESCINWAKEQEADIKLVEVMRLIQSFNKDENEGRWSTFLSGSEWFKLRNELLVVENVLILKVDDTLKVVVPRQSVSVVLNFLHDSPLAGHRDFEKRMIRFEISFIG
jgi:hypothetical protein